MKKSILFLICLNLILITSCNKESVEIDKSLAEIELREGDLIDNKTCFELVYPIDVELPDGSTITIENEESFSTDVKSWYVNNPDVKVRPNLVYPIQITFEGDKSKVISSEEQMMRVKRYCRDKLDKKRYNCFKIIYPVTYLMPDGSEITGESAEEIRVQIKEWYESNPSDLKPELSYPVDVKINGHGTISIGSEEEMIALKKKCAQKDKDTRACFKLNFPVSFTMPDGTDLTVNSEDEMNAFLKEWHTENPDVDKKPSLNYPVEIIFNDGKTYTISNEKEMIELKRKCESK